MSDKKKNLEGNGHIDGQYSDNHDEDEEMDDFGGGCGGGGCGECEMLCDRDVPSGVLYRIIIDGVANGFIVSEYLRTGSPDDRTLIRVFEKKKDLERALKEMLSSIEEIDDEE